MLVYNIIIDPLKAGLLKDAGLLVTLNSRFKIRVQDSKFKIGDFIENSRFKIQKVKIPNLEFLQKTGAKVENSKS